MRAPCSERIWFTIARPRPVPRPLVEKYGRNSFSLSSAEMPQPVSATSSSTDSPAVACVVDQQALHQRIAHRFRRIVDQIDHHALELLRIDVHRREIRARSTRRSIPSRRPANTSSALRTISFRSLAPAVRRESARIERIRRPASSPIPLRAKWWPSIRAGCAAASGVDSAPRSSWRAIRSAHKRNRRQRILQLMRDAARHFVPGRGFLRAQQLAGVFEHHHESGRVPGGAPAARKP